MRHAALLMAVAAFGVGACTRTAGAGRAPAAPAVSSASLDGSAVLQQKCTVCHDLGGLSAYAGSWGEPEWRSMIETMIAYGAQLTDPEVDTLAAYLGVNFGTDGPATDSASAPTGGNAEVAGLLESACTTCHDLSAITANPGAYSEADFRDTVQRMIGYGAPVSQNQVEPLVAYLVETYGG